MARICQHRTRTATLHSTSGVVVGSGNRLQADRVGADCQPRTRTARLQCIWRCASGVANGRLDVADLLVERGASVSGDIRRTPLDMALLGDLHPSSFASVFVNYPEVTRPIFTHFTEPGANGLGGRRADARRKRTLLGGWPGWDESSP